MFVVQFFFMLNATPTNDLLEKMNEPADFSKIAEAFETNNTIDAYVLALVFILCIRYAEIIWSVNFFVHVMHEVGVYIGVLYVLYWMMVAMFAVILQTTHGDQDYSFRNFNTSMLGIVSNFITNESNDPNKT